MCMNNRFYPKEKPNIITFTFDDNLELMESYDRLLDWLITEACIQEDPTIMKHLRRAQFQLPLNL